MSCPGGMGLAEDMDNLCRAFSRDGSVADGWVVEVFARVTSIVPGEAVEGRDCYGPR